MIFEAIAPKALHGVWPFVRQGLERVKLKGQETWLPEDVYVALRTGRALLHFAKQDNHIAGFFIVEPIEEPFTFVPLLNIWILYAPAESGNFADALQFEDDCLAEFYRLAKVMNCSRIRFYGRKGWEKRLPSFKPLRVIYECPVPHLESSPMKDSP